jgi:SAM-dependent methyltransferase
MTDKITECPLCSAHDFAPFIRARDFHYGNQGWFTLVRCSHCRLCFQDPMPDDSELSSYYPATYYAYKDRFDKKPLPASKILLKTLLGINDLETKDPVFQRPGKMLDVGCGSGWFLAQMRDKGWEVKGVEPSSAAASLGQSQRGLDIFNGTLWDAQFDSGSFDYVRLNHSFEHMGDPNRALREIWRILARNGKLMIGVPNGTSLNARLFGQFWYHLALPVHTFLYSPSTIRKILEKHGFAVQRMIFNTDNAGIQGSIQFLLNRNDEPLKAEGMVTDSRLARVLTYWMAHLQNLFHISDFIEVTAVKKTV